MRTIITIMALAIATGMTSQTATSAKPKVAATIPVASANAKFEQDKAIIKSMCGIYKVSFDFAETFSSDTSYNFYRLDFLLRF